MKATTLLTVAAAISFGLQMPPTFAQVFNSGSDGSMGALVVTTGTNLNVPPDGKFHFTTISVSPGGTLTFIRNALNTPVYLLATGDVLLLSPSFGDGGIINVSGAGGTAITGGAGGPGGFDGGGPNGFGYGPGGGKAGTDSGGADNAGSGSYATQASGSSTNKGSTYGSRLLVPLVGGSGGGGTPGGGGGGGGGAIVIASNTRIELRGPATHVRSAGGGGVGGAGGGSGGGIRLVAPVVTGNGSLEVPGGGGDGRIRVDTIDRSGLALQVTAGTGGSSWSSGAFMTVFPPNNPKLDIIQAAGTTIPEGTNAPVVINLPFGSDTNRTVTVQARNFGGVVPIEVVLTPQTGAQLKVQAQIDNTANPATVTVPVAFQVNTPTTVNAWTR